MVRLTALLKSRNESKRDESSGARDNQSVVSGSGKGQSMHLHSEDLSLLFESVYPARKSEQPESAAPDEPDPREQSAQAAPPASADLPPGKTEAPETRGPYTSLPGSRAYNPRQDTDDDSLSSDRRESIIADTIYIEMLDLIEELYTVRSERREGEIERLVSLTEQLIEACEKSNVILRKAVRLKKEQESLTMHSLNTAILAIKIGFSRGFTRERLFSLALCALLHDIGMIKVDDAILKKKEKLTQDEFMEITRHVKYSQEILAQDYGEFPFLVPIVDQIHERENGSGYPHGLKGENIHEFAKIIGLCDVYIAMISRKAHRGDFSGYATLQQIISRRGIDFSPQIVKSLIDVISVFPLESLVKLNNGAIGRVIDISPVHPTRPKLLILINSDGEQLKNPKFVDMEQEPLLYVETPDVEEGVILHGGDVS